MPTFQELYITKRLERERQVLSQVINEPGTRKDLLENPIVAGEDSVIVIPDSLKVRVIITRPNVPTWFANTFGISEPINGEAASCGNGATIGFKCSSAEQAKEFHDVAVAAGGASIEDPPGLRSGDLGSLYLAYVRDPDGNKLCAIYRPK